MILEFNVYEQTLTFVGDSYPAAYSSDYLYVHFNFLTSEWKGIKTGLFRFKGDQKTVAVVLDAEDKCLVPDEVIRDGELYISVYCEYGTPENGDVIVTADKPAIKIKESLRDGDIVPPKPKPDTFEYVKSWAGTGAILYIRRNAGVFEYSQDGTTWLSKVQTANTLEGLTATVAELNTINNKLNKTEAASTYIPLSKIANNLTTTAPGNVLDASQGDILSNKLSDLQAYIGYTDTDIYGLEADFKNNKFTRLSGAVGKTAGADFDSISCFGGRKRCNVTDDGVILSYYGYGDYTETGKTTTAITVGGVTYPVGTPVQVMVYQPKFYYKMVPLELTPQSQRNVLAQGYDVRKARYYVAATPKEGFKLFPAFISNGIKREYILLSAFKGSIYDTSATSYLLTDGQVADFAADKLSSIAGAKPCSGLTQNLTRANARNLAHNRGAGWELSYAATIALSQWLIIIEYGTFNTQTAIGKGVVDITDDGATNMAVNTGGTSSLGNASGMAPGTNGLVSISYRGEEDFWGNIWSFVDGINVWGDGKLQGGVLYISDHDFTDSKKTDNYVSAGFTLANATGYTSAMGYNSEFDWLFFTTETLGNTNLPVGDQNYVKPDLNTYNIALFGCIWRIGLQTGGFCWGLHNTVTYRERIAGARIVYIPQPATA